MMKPFLYPAVVISAVVAAVIVSVVARPGAADTKAPAAHAAGGEMPQAVFANYDDLKWGKILPDLGDDSPEICILHVDPQTKATKLLIRTPKAIHIRKHWHSGNETHTMIVGKAIFACDGKRIEQGPG